MTSHRDVSSSKMAFIQFSRLTQIFDDYILCFMQITGCVQHDFSFVFALL